jgi:hypothetical protein
MVAMVAVMIAYLFLMNLIGYLLASLLFFFLINRTAGAWSLATNLVVSILMTASFYFIFVWWMEIIFPRGLLFDF